MESEILRINITIPFQTTRLAQIAYDVLRVDAEPKRSAINKQLSVKNNVLVGNFTGESAQQLRVGVNCFFENVALVIETFEFTGPPVSDKYSHY